MRCVLFAILLLLTCIPHSETVAKRLKITKQGVPPDNCHVPSIPCAQHGANQSGDSERVAGMIKGQFDGYSHKYCKGDSDNWQSLTERDHAIVGDDLARALGVRAGDAILDYGSGCGSKIRRINNLGACGYGVDLSCSSVKHAASHSKYKSVNKYCCTDAVPFVQGIPTDVFDGVMSFGSLQYSWTYLIRIHPEKKGDFWLPLFCDTVWALVHGTKPHRKVVLSGLLGGLIKRSHFQSCIQKWQSIHAAVRISASYPRQSDFHHQKAGERYWGKRSKIPSRDPNATMYDASFTAILSKQYL